MGHCFCILRRKGIFSQNSNENEGLRRCPCLCPGRRFRRCHPRHPSPSRASRHIGARPSPRLCHHCEPQVGRQLRLRHRRGSRLRQGHPTNGHQDHPSCWDHPHPHPSSHQDRPARCHRHHQARCPAHPQAGAAVQERARHRPSRHPHHL